MNWFIFLIFTSNVSLFVLLNKYSFLISFCWSDTWFFVGGLTLHEWIWTYSTVILYIQFHKMTSCGIFSLREARWSIFRPSQCVVYSHIAKLCFNIGKKLDQPDTQSTTGETCTNWKCVCLSLRTNAQIEIFNFDSLKEVLKWTALQVLLNQSP